MSTDQNGTPKQFLTLYNEVHTAIYNDDSLNAFHVALWDALFYFCNRSRWSEWFTVPNSELIRQSKVGRSSIQEYRKQLADKGYIEFRSSKTKKAPTAQGDDRTTKLNEYHLCTMPPHGIANNTTMPPHGIADNNTMPPHGIANDSTMPPHGINYAATRQRYIRQEDNIKDNTPKIGDMYSNNKKSAKQKTASAAEPESFKEFYAAYPKHVHHKDALKAWIKLDPDDALKKRIMKSVEEHKKTNKWKNGYAEEPATFLNQELWTDELEEVKPASDNYYPYFTD